MSEPITVPPNIVVLDSAVAVANQAAVEFQIRARTAVQERGKFVVALSGGTTPTEMFEMLASTEFEEALPWPDTHVFWSDERCVPPHDEGSNYGIAWRTFLSQVDVPSANIHRMKGELDPAAGADDYRRQLAAFFAGGPTRFDLMFLGLGADGHTASLFPHSGALEAIGELCVANLVEDAPVAPWRLTLTFPAINASRAVIFLVESESKADILPIVLDGPRDVTNVPAQGVQPTDGELLWVLDRAAASKLNL